MTSRGEAGAVGARRPGCVGSERRRSPQAGLAAALALAVVVGGAAATTRPALPRMDPRAVPAVSSAVARARPAVVGLRARVSPDRPSSATLGTDRWGAAVVIEPDGLAVTVGYLVLEADALEVTLEDGRASAARVVGHDFESGLALIRLAGPGPYPAAPLGRPAGLAAGDPVSIVGIDESHAAVAVAARVTHLRPFVAYWEYLLERGIVVAPHHRAFGGAALVDPAGALVGIVSLRLPEGHLAIPIDLLPPVRDALLAQGRPARPPRPWLGVRAVAIDGGVGIASVSPVGPAHAAGLEPGDVIVRLDGDRVADVEDFYRKLWRTAVGGEIQLTVYRDSQLRSLTVRPQDRYAIFRFRSP